MSSSKADDPHRNLPVLHRGRALDSAQAAVVLLHGRGASAEDILGLAEEFALPELAYLAPEAAEHTWYPYSFLAPIEQNQPSSGTRSRSLDSRKALAWQRNSWPEIQCVTVVSLHLRAGLLVRPGLNSTMSASSQAPPAFSARVIVIPTSPGSELRSQRPFSLGSAEL